MSVQIEIFWSNDSNGKQWITNLKTVLMFWKWKRCSRFQNWRQSISISKILTPACKYISVTVKKKFLRWCVTLCFIYDFSWTIQHFWNLSASKFYIRTRQTNGFKKFSKILHQLRQIDKLQSVTLPQKTTFFSIECVTSQIHDIDVYKKKTPETKSELHRRCHRYGTRGCWRIKKIRNSVPLGTNRERKLSGGMSSLSLTFQTNWIEICATLTGRRTSSLGGS